MNCPFSLENNDLYHQWKNNKLSAYPLDLNEITIEIQNALVPNRENILQIITTTNKHNFSFYKFSEPDARDKQTVHTLGKIFGLTRLDGNICADNDKLTSIEARDNPGQHEYIPYTTKKLSWHTDGYYNSMEHQIYGMLLHCAQPAKYGGESLLMDTDIAYILLRDENPDYIRALMQDDVFTIPANILNGVEIRAEQSGPVFSVSTQGRLHMRYSARKRNVKWKDDDITREAVSFLDDLWENGSPYIIKHKMHAGEGLICNNILHCRTAFENSGNEAEKRLLYRGRYYDRLISEV